MNKPIHFGGAVMAALLACSAAGAQMHGGGVSGASAPARVAPVRVAPPATRVSTAPSPSGTHATGQGRVMRIAPNGHGSFSTGPLANSASFGFDDDEIGVPGLGFDYAHLAAIRGNLHNNFGRHEHREQNFVTPIFFGGFPYYNEFSDYQQVEQQPQIIVIQQPAPVVTVQQETHASQDSAIAPEMSTASPATTAPVSDIGEFVLVRRDGKVLFAAVFSVIGTQLRYVTPEGIRHTLPMAELDIAATQDMNEARGTTVQFPN